MVVTSDIKLPSPLKRVIKRDPLREPATRPEAPRQPEPSRLPAPTRVPAVKPFRPGGTPCTASLAELDFTFSREK